jgi:hypothetical protein
VSAIVDYLVFVGSPLETSLPMVGINQTLYEVDRERRQYFNEIDMGGAGGSKWFTNDVWAAAFNHLQPETIRAALAGAPWRYPDQVLVVEKSCDYGIQARALTIPELRAELAGQPLTITREQVEDAVATIGPLSHPKREWPAIEQGHAVELVLAVLAKLRPEGSGRQ